MDTSLDVPASPEIHDLPAMDEDVPAPEHHPVPSPSSTSRRPTCKDVEDERDNPMGQPSNGPSVYLDDGPALQSDPDVTPEDI